MLLAPKQETMVTYNQSETEVRVGDHVVFRNWLFFWRSWQAGRVHYVPGISPKNPQLEFNGMSWVAIHDGRDGQIGIFVDPETHQLQNTVRFLKRSDDELHVTPTDYFFGDDKTE